ncbi:MAG: hypothetical protein Q8N83_09275 [Ignavibacteria bacterium]|nr:hypothetical protein [Ignavibacteria bacterium]
MAALFKKNLFLQILLALHVVINIYLLTLPLTKYFSFEFASLTGFFLVIYVALFTLHEDKFKSSAIAVKVFQFKLLIFSGIFLFIPVLLAFIFHLFRNDCSFVDGFKFYAVLALPGVVIGYAVGLLSDLINKKYSYLIFILLLIVIALIPLFEIYFRPQIYFYDPLIPFYPGTMYDEDIDITLAIVLYRVFNLFFFGGMIVLIRKLQLKELKLSRVAFSFIIIFISGSFIFLSPKLGFGTTETVLNQALQKKIVTGNFVIYLPQQLNKEEEKYITHLHEYYFQKQMKFFKGKPEQKITSFVFRTSDEKRKYFGAGNADVAKPWLNQIYLSLDSYEQSLNHELAHVFAGMWSKNFLKIDANYNPATVEGIASAADPFFDDMDIHYSAFLASKNNLRLSIQSLFSGFSFFTNVSSLSYIYSGSFCKFIIDEYGIQKFKEFYRNGNFEKSYNKSLAESETQYRKFLDNKDYQNNQHTANYYFGRVPLVQKVCPRYLANETNEIYKLIEEKDFVAAKEEILSIKDYNKNYSLLSGLIFCLEEENPPKAETLIEKNLLNYKNTPYWYLLQLKLVDEKIVNGKFSDAEVLLDSLVIWNPTGRLASRVTLRNILLHKGNLASQFIKAQEIDLFNILRDEFANNSSPALLLPLIGLVAKEKVSYASVGSLIQSSKFTTNETDWYSVLQLVRFTIKHFDFVSATKLITILEKNLPGYALESLQNEKDKLEWFIKHAEKK